MAKDKKAKKAEKKARVAARQEKKEKKAAKKGPRQDDDSDADDVDIDAVLAEYARQQEQFLKVTETVCEPPSARSSATVLGSPSNDNELLLFGGEYFDGAVAKFYNDLFVYNINRDEWKLVTSPNSPLPRSGHAWCQGGNNHIIYLFGGEFSSPKQGTFYHYNDFWRLDPQTREWTRLESKGKGPSARSGHRMTFFKNYIILFGGFQDTSQQTKYLQDLWIYDCANFTWHEPALPPASGKPDARSSFSLLPHEKGAVLYGGYSRVKTGPSAGGGGGKQAAGGSTSKALLKPMIHQDGWFLRITPHGSEASSSALPVVRWERRKRPANAPNPPRVGATMCVHKSRGLLFGGVHDIEASEESMDSEFFNQFFAFNIDRNRFVPLTLRRPRVPAKKATADRAKRERGKQAEEELLANLKALEMKHRTGAVDDPDTMDWDGFPENRVDDADNRPEKPVIFEPPHPRFNAQLAVQADVLYVFGGTFERGDREYTFDEMWAVDLGKLDGFKEIYRREPEDWRGSEEEESEGDEEGDEDVSDAEQDSGDEPETQASSEATTAASKSTANTSTSTPATEEEATEELSSALSDALPHPRPFESLREFFARTTKQWQDIVLEQQKELGEGADAQTVKELKKKAFDRAEEKWWDCREEIRALEDEQMEAGIGEVISLADKAEAAGAGRRR